MSVQLSREMALRIGMAARALPGVSAGPLLNGLVGQLGWPLNEDKLARLTVTQLRNALSQGGSIDADIDMPTADVADRFGVALLKEVVEILWGNKVERRRRSARDRTVRGRRPPRFDPGGGRLRQRRRAECPLRLRPTLPDLSAHAPGVPADRRPAGRRRRRGGRQLRLPRPVDRRLPRALRAVDRRPGGGEGHQHGGLPAQVHRRGPGPALPRRALQEDGLGASALAGEGHERAA